MASLFPRWSNNLSRVMGAVLLVAPVAGIGGAMMYVRSPFVLGSDQERDQPVQFDHRHHNWEQGIDCRYCHTSVETSPTAGIPSTSTCMGCHAQVWNKSPRLEPVRQAFFQQKPIEWVKVHDLPDFVYFNHSIHVAKGVGCATCHGRVDTMPSLRQNAPLTMGWCLDCHRNPAPNLRPQEVITSMTWQPPHAHEEAEKLAETLAEQNGVHTRTSCDTCHR